MNDLKTKLHVEFVRIDSAKTESRGYLSYDEEQTYNRLSAPKRRKDWLAGRLASKTLLAKRLEGMGRPVPFNEIEIGNDHEGAPTWRVPRRLELPKWSLSITHSGDFAAAAIHDDAARLGVDLEKIEVRNPAWIEIAFHPDERAPDIETDPLVGTRLWTVKEAVLKALGLGLRADLWDVRCLPGDVQLHGRALQRHKELGSPELRLAPLDAPEGHVMSVAFFDKVAEPWSAANANAKGELLWTR